LRTQNYQLLVRRQVQKKGQEAKEVQKATSESGEASSEGREGGESVKMKSRGGKGCTTFLNTKKGIKASQHQQKDCGARSVNSIQGEKAPSREERLFKVPKDANMDRESRRSRNGSRRSKRRGMRKSKREDYQFRQQFQFLSIDSTEERKRGRPSAQG